MPSARSTPNIALIKYWGNSDNRLRLPAADSLSMTLDGPSLTVTIEPAPTLSVTSFTMGKEKILKEKDFKRFETYIELVKEQMNLWQLPSFKESLQINVHSEIPPAIGLASSSAIFSALAKAIAALAPDAKLSDAQVSVLARLGSGSAARSIFGGFAALRATGVGEQIATAGHWPLHDIIIVPSIEEKTVGSTEGHALAWTSPHFPARVEAIRSRRYQECVDAIIAQDFAKLQKIVEEDCMDMHHVMETSTPALRYLNDDTHRIVQEITDLRAQKHLPVLYTMDAGPTVHLFCTLEALQDVRAFAQAQKGCTVYETIAGEGAACLKN